MKKSIKWIGLFIVAVIILMVGVGLYKFNYLSALLHYYLQEPIPKAEIVIENDTIYFKGMIEWSNYELLLEEIDRYPEVKFTKMIINSEGGDTVYGRKIAHFVFDHQLDIEVEEVCFSSCANYIFPAGNTKYIQKDALVGWHGSEFQGLFLKADTQTVEEYHEEELRQALLDSGFTDLELSEEERRMFITGMADEWKFFEKIKVSIALPLLGIKKLSEDLPYQGWFYSIEDMEKFGLNNIVYLGEESEYPILKDEDRGKLLKEKYDQEKVEEIEWIISDYVKKINAE